MLVFFSDIFFKRNTPRVIHQKCKKLYSVSFTNVKFYETVDNIVVKIVF
jgi:hypothetical protein